MKKEILYRLIEEVIKESDGAYTIDELKELLRNIKGYDYDAYAQFASLVPFIIEEMSDTLGVVEVIESDSGVPDIKIIFKDAEATKNFARILQSAGLEGSGYPGHYKINKGMSRFKDHPKYHNKSLPSVKFNADHYYKGIEEEVLEEEGKKDACYHKVKANSKVWPSAYASGRLVQCRKVGAANYGNKSKKEESLREEFETHDMYDPKTGKKFVAQKEQDHKAMAAKGYTHVDPKRIEKVLRDEGGASGMDPFLKEFGKEMEEEIVKTLDAMPNVGQHKDKDYILDDNKEVEIAKEGKKKAGTESSKESSLRDWFGRKGAKGSKGGWVDCNAPDGSGGYKSCGRSDGEKRKKYPSCRPTPGACKEKGKGKSWGKKAAKKNEGMLYEGDDSILALFEDATLEEGGLVCGGCLFEVLQEASCGCPDLVGEAEYQGRKVTLNKPMRGDVKKFKVYVKDPKTGNIKKVNFGHGGSSAKSKGEKTMKIRKNNPKARKSFRARHNCDNPGPKTKARYWSCRKW
jgi:hypothetical protein